MLTWPEAFGLTLALETPVYGWALRPVLGLPAAIATSLVLNVATHPLAFHLAPRLGRAGFAVGETVVWAVETVLLVLLVRKQKLPLGEAALITFVANALSAGVGLLF